MNEPLPTWIGSVTVPGARRHDERIQEILSAVSALQAESQKLAAQRDQILGFRQLLYGSGKFVLEPVVRRALRSIGLTVLEPDEYTGEWDISAEDQEGRYYVGEVEGAEGPVDLEKHRQLLQYHNDEVAVGKDPKGLLIGNGFRLTPPDSRTEQFTEHAIRAASRVNFCLLPTAELFKAVCAVLEKDEEALKKEIRDSIFCTTGVWRYSRPGPIVSSQIEMSEDTKR
jgi:hypothetical protein